jgi:hypothetical protein
MVAFAKMMRFWHYRAPSMSIEDMVLQMAESVCYQMKYVRDKNGPLGFTFYAFNWNDCPYFREIQGLLQQELRGRFPNTPVHVIHKERNEWWRLCCCFDRDDVLTVSIS